MKELLTRAIFGLVFLAVVFVPYFIDVNQSLTTFPLVLFLFSVIGTTELFRMAENTGYTKKGLFVALAFNTLLFAPALLLSFGSLFYHFTGEGIGAAQTLLIRLWFLNFELMTYVTYAQLAVLVIVGSCFAVFSIQVFSKEALPSYFKFPITTSVFYLILPLALLALTYSTYSPAIVNTSMPYMLLYVLLPIYLNDTMAYLFGRAFGKHKMMPTVSPKKTWEGFIGGILGALLLMEGFLYLMQGTISEDWLMVAILSISASILATLGDLFESKLKRTAGVKDSGTILPGHGGILDRIDAMLFVSPILYVLLILIS